MTRNQVKSILDRVLNWPAERQEDIARVIERMEEQDSSTLRLSDEQAPLAHEPHLRRILFTDLRLRSHVALAREHEHAVNLGQGFPDDPGPEDVRKKAAEAVVSGWNQYPPMMGLPELRKAVAAHYKHWQGLTLDPESRSHDHLGRDRSDRRRAACALIEPGDEVVLFQPMYDAYLPLVRRAGGVPKLVRLKPPHWRFTEEDLANAFSPRTKVVLFNNPLNPTATVYGADQLSCSRISACRMTASRRRRGLGARHLRRPRAHPDAQASPACASARSRSARPGKSFR
jgi:DNA-binding transcriptional MocR family regulator